MGKLHKIRRLLNKPQQREQLKNYLRGVWVRKRCQPMIFYGNAHRQYVKKILRGYKPQ